ncbi:flagellar protein FlaG [Anaerocolumna jejuensis DSM 15929]|uniref:Flagellar protein FlaG n=1 Tax=Anaerocolumna jejuensis DSM 15929 TaxID=1121322 RepID=A0A1M7B5M1_9FIRM|nr:flagellar protein FlaG [Anaerocolumna jejuensis]SHL50237.1 flagellar protein FlaG [Anaerocolumna jejuensis DSM 15929]
MAINSITNAAANYSDMKTDIVVSKTLAESKVLPSTSTREGTEFKGIGTTAKDEQQTNDANAKRIKSLVEGANKQAGDGRRVCEYSYHEDIGRISIKVKDAVTNEVIKEIPSEDVIKMIEKLWESAGIMVDKKL